MFSFSHQSVPRSGRRRRVQGERVWVDRSCKQKFKAVSKCRVATRNFPLCVFFVSPDRHLPRDGCCLLPLPLLLLPHLQAEPEGHVRPPHLHLGARRHIAIEVSRIFVVVTVFFMRHTRLLLPNQALFARLRSPRRRLLLTHGQHWTRVGTTVRK